MKLGGEGLGELVGVIDLVPAFVPTIAHQGAAQSDHIFCSFAGPKHSRLLETLADDGTASASTTPDP